MARQSGGHRATGVPAKKDGKKREWFWVAIPKAYIDGQVFDPVVKQLEALSSSRQNVLKYAGLLMLSISGYDQDQRELYEIPECNSYMRELARRWRYWFHFLGRDTDNFSIVLRMLSNVVVERPPGGLIMWSFDDMKDVKEVVVRLAAGTRDLHLQHDLDEAYCLDAGRQVRAVLETVIGVKMGPESDSTTGAY